MSRYLLDTNVVSSLVRDPHGPLTGKLREMSRHEVFTSIIVACELRYGAHKRGSARLTAQLEAVLQVLAVAPFESPADTAYAAIRADLERAGLPIGANDLLIAAHALALDSVLVTDNTREFSRIEGLRCENWLRVLP